jgi:alkylation response protein AidB-like acyl-CoA dehydrogenase
VASHWIADRQSGPSILRHGAEEQKKRFLPAIARGECFFSIGMSEPESGSDLASVRTGAERVGGGWLVNGTKIWAGRARSFVASSRAGWALSASGLPMPGGPLTAAPMRSDEGVVFRRVGAGWALSGRARCVPAARYAARLVVVGRREGGGTMVAAVDPGCCGISRGENLAGETRDDVTLDGVRAARDEVAPAGWTRSG